MLSLRYLFRANCTPSSLPKQVYARSLSTSSLCNSDRKNPPKKDEPDENITTDSKKSEALKKLNSLLNTMVGEEYKTSKTLNKQMARPKRQPKSKSEPKESNDRLEPLITTAARNVAVSFGGDVQQTESELLTKLRSSESGKNTSTKSTVSLNELIVGMKIDRTKKTAEPEGRASQVRRIMDNQRGGGDRERNDRRSGNYRQRDDGRGRMDDGRGRMDDGRGRMDDGRGRMDDNRSRYREERRPRMAPIQVNLFDNEALGIFTTKSKQVAGAEVATVERPVLATWDSLYERELRLAVTHPPNNVFEEMILWTEQGKLWNFPIDNEQGLDVERQVYFAEHVFLEPRLDAWCPRKGPVRHFMELVCVGLSKNPYLTVQEKRDHIDWFREYFDQKQDILKDTGALDSVPEQARIES